MQVVKSPGSLVVSAYMCCPDITATITHNLKLPGRGQLPHVPMLKAAHFNSQADLCALKLCRSLLCRWSSHQAT